MFVGSRRIGFQILPQCRLEEQFSGLVDRPLRGRCSFRRPRAAIVLASSKGLLDPPMPVSSRPFAKNRRSDAHQRCAFLRPIAKVLRHPHRKLRKIDMKLCLQPVAQFAQLNKIFPGCFGFLGNRGIVIRPRIDNRGSASRFSRSSRSFSGVNPNLLPSPATFTPEEPADAIHLPPRSD